MRVKQVAGILLAVADTASASGYLSYASQFGVPGRNASYDYVIIGGGTAGLAIATRIAQNTSNSVAIIEAGGFYEVDNGNTSVVPRLGSYGTSTSITTLHDSPTVDWEFETAPQASLNEIQAHYWRGKTLGGSSALNNAVYQRGTIGSYQMWADAVGDQSYTFDALLPYFRKSVQFTPANAALRPQNASVLPVSGEAFSPSGGPLKVSYTNYAIPFDSWMQKAFNEIGLSEIQDFVSGNLIGHQYTSHQTEADEQTRSSSESSFLREALDSSRTNLQIYPNTLAKRILFSSDKTATGVEVNTAGTSYTISANHEVILSAGAFQSPQLLMVSGVGPSSTLNNLSIPVIADRQGVGQNLWDHVMSGPVYPVDVGNVAKYTVPSLIAASTQEYMENRTGVMTGYSFDFIGWTKLPASYRPALGPQALADLAQFPADWPEIEYVIAEAPGTVPGANYALIYNVLVAPLSRGNVTIRSNDTAEKPLINPNWLGNETDQKLMIEAFKTARALFNTTALRTIVNGPELSPGDAVQTDEEILAFIRSQTATLYHASCTCKFSPVKYLQ